MQIIIKENEDGIMCLFDTRSGLFFPGGRIRNREDKGQKIICDPIGANSLLDTLNRIADKRSREIVELSENPNDEDSGLAQRYLRLNPDIRLKVTEKIAAKVDRKTVRKPKGRKAIAEAQADKEFSKVITNAEKKSEKITRSELANVLDATGIKSKSKEEWNSDYQELFTVLATAPKKRGRPPGSKNKK